MITSIKNSFSSKPFAFAAIILLSLAVILTVLRVIALNEEAQMPGHPIREKRANLTTSDVALPKDFFERMDFATISQNFKLALEQLEESEHFYCSDGVIRKNISFADETDTGEYYFLFEWNENRDWSPNNEYSFYATDSRIMGEFDIVNGKAYFHSLMFEYYSDSLRILASYIGSQKPVPEEFITRMYFCADAFKGVTASGDLHEELDTDAQPTLQ